MGNSVTTNSPKIIFSIVSDKTDALALLNEAERRDTYLEQCHTDKRNYWARRNLSYYPNEISIKHLDYALEYLRSIQDDIPLKLQSELSSVNIIQLMPSADGGMPHTRPENIICFPDISQLFSKTTVLHELWHVHQRKYKVYWLEVFRRLGWTEWHGELPVQLEENMRYNPDTIDSRLWIFQNTWVPVVVFRDISRPSVSDVEVWFYNVPEGHHVKQVPPEMENYFGSPVPAAFEHPREMTAYMLSEPYMYTGNRAFQDLLDSMGRIAVNTKNRQY